MHDWPQKTHDSPRPFDQEIPSTPQTNPKKLKRFPLFSRNARGFRVSSTIALTCASLLGSADLSQGAVIASDDFSGSIDPNWGSLHGKGGGTGFSSDWASPGYGGGNIYNPSGNALGISPAKRDLSATIGDTGTIWVSFDWSCNDNTNGANTGATQEWGTFSFFNGGSEIFAVGNPWHNNTWILGGADSGVSNVGARKTGVIQFTLGEGATDSAKLWVGTTGSPVDVSGAAAATVSGFNINGVNGIRIMGTAEQTFDNLFIGDTNLDVAASAPTATWTHTAGGTWGTAAGAGSNWSNALVGGGSGNTANFNTLNLTADATVNLDSARTIGNLVFGDTETSSAFGWTLANNGNSANILTLAGTTPTITVNALGDTKSVTISAVVAGTQGLTKAGAGTLTLSGANTYTGATVVSQGTLLVNGSTASGSAVSVASGATLGGNGTVGGAATISGTHTPGNSLGVQSFSSNLSYASTSIFEWDLANSATGTRGTDYDGVNVGGTLSGTSGAIFKVVLGAGAFTDTFWDTNRSWSDIFKAVVDGTGSSLDIASVFSNINWYQGVTNMTGLTGTEGSFTISGSSLTWTAVPEPTSALAGLLIAAGLLRRRRKF